MTILKPPSDPLESSTLSVSGETLTLGREECAPTDPSGEHTLVNSPDTVAQTILAARPLERS